MKKFVSILLVFVMLFSMTCTAFAVESSDIEDTEVVEVVETVKNDHSIASLIYRIHKILLELREKNLIEKNIVVQETYKVAVKNEGSRSVENSFNPYLYDFKDGTVDELNGNYTINWNGVCPCEHINHVCSICGGVSINDCHLLNSTAYDEHMDLVDGLCNEIRSQYSNYNVIVYSTFNSNDTTVVGNDGSAGCIGNHDKCGNCCSGHTYMAANEEENCIFFDNCGNACFSGMKHNAGVPCVSNHNWSISLYIERK